MDPNGNIRQLIFSHSFPVSGSYIPQGLPSASVQVGVYRRKSSCDTSASAALNLMSLIGTFCFQLRAPKPKDPAHILFGPRWSYICLRQSKLFNEAKESKERTMDAFALLKADHKKVSGLFDELEAASGKAKLRVFAQIKTELELHTHIEETIFYPALEK